MADLQFIRNIFNEKDLLKYKLYFEKEIEKLQNELDNFIIQGKERIEIVEEYEKTNQFKILGSTYKDGKRKGISLIKRYIDGTQTDERYYFDKIADMRKKLVELKEKYNEVDWSMFEEEI